jgi:hypothetical protein
MKVRAYIRVAKNGYKYLVAAQAKENSQPLHKVFYGAHANKEFLPTISFAVDLNIPDELFSKASRVIAEINIGLKDAVIAAEVPVPAKKK